MQESEVKPMCKHENEHLISTNGTIKCRLCGKEFKSWAELEEDRKPEEEIITEEEQAEEKPKKKAPTKKGAKK